jgi:NAD(P)-dependent dehydrogenase (short-subunit alcohol dehydrogenase family)
MRLKDKVILVTASTRGIGPAIVKKCALEGAQVYMAARHDCYRSGGKTPVR